LIQGLAHGHDDVAATKDAVLKTESSNTVANASVRMFNEVTESNLNGFHFHGDQAAYEISAVIVIPNNAKAEALLAGRFLKGSIPVQIIRPSEEFDALMSTLFQLQSLALAVMALTIGAALAIAALVFALSFRLRRLEFATLADVGVSPVALSLTKLFEVLIVGALGLLIAAGVSLLVQINAPSWVRWLLA
jgi:putative ABC transport system permease protein